MNVPPERDEQALSDAMGRYADGDAAAFQEVYRMLAPAVTGCLRRWVGDPQLAADLTQETFLRVHRARDRYRRGAPPGPWVLTIARRQAIDALRRKGSARDRLTADGVVRDVAAPTPDEPTPEWLLQEVRDAVSALPAGQRAVVAMHKLEGRSMAEVAVALGIREGAARVRAHRGYERLRLLLGGVRTKERP